MDNQPVVAASDDAQHTIPPEVMEKVVIGGDLSELNAAQRADYYTAVCRSLGLNPLTKPFEFLTLNGKLRLYALRDCADQLRRLHGISIYITNRERMGDIYIVTARAKDRAGREDESTGAVALGNLKGDALANALMKAECLTLDSEILTKRGFKYFDEVIIGEDVLAYDTTTDSCVWTPLRDVTVYDSAPVVRFGTPLHGFRCTPDHSWAVSKEIYKPDRRGDGSRGARGAYASRKPDRFLCKALDIRSSHAIVLAARAEEGRHRLSPLEAAIIGWVMCDGRIIRHGHSVRLGISQSKPGRVEQIERLLFAAGVRYHRHDGKPTTRTFPSGRTYDCLPQTWFYLSTRDSVALFSKAGIYGSEDLPALVTQLSGNARRRMLEAMMAADGDARGRFGRKRKPGVMEAWQILATLEGYALGKMGMSSVGEVPLQRLRRQRTIAGANVRLTPLGNASVWCPTTDFGTWVTRQNGNVAITGNTKAKRRVTLSIAGLGWLDETELATIPGAQTYAPDAAHDPPVMSLPLAVGEDGTPGAATPLHPTAEDITTLVNSARAANVDLEAFGHDMRRLMQLPESQKITKKFLRATMTMNQYNTARGHYGEALRVIIEEDVPTHEPPSEAVDADASQVVHTPTGEGPTASPSPAGLSFADASAPGEAATVDPAYHKLYQEALGWGIAASEIEHILKHHDLGKSRTLLWTARRTTPAATPIEASAAD